MQKPTRENLKERIEELEKEIDGLKRSHIPLRESEERHRTLFESITLGVVYQDRKGIIITANPAAERILGLSLEQMLGRTSLDPRWHAIHEDGSIFQGETHPSMVALNTGKEVRNVIMGIFHPLLEEYRWINIHAVPQFRSGEEAAYQAYTTFDDITDQKKARDALRRSEERFRAMAENIREVFWLFDWKNKRIEYVSPAYSQIWGRPVEELYANYKKWYSSIYPDDLDHARKSFAEIAQSGGDKICEYRILRPDGTVGWISDRGFAVKDKNGDVVRIAGIAKDITERKKTRKAMQIKDRRLEHQAKNLEEVNTTLRVLLEQREKENVEMIEALTANIKKRVYPFIEKLEQIGLNEEAFTFANIIKSNINNLIAPLASNLSSEYFGLTASEIQIADLIKLGKTSNEIASILSVSPKTISFHRGNLRKKLGLLNKKINLRTFLQSLSS